MSKTDLNPEVRGYFAAFEPDYFPQKGKWFEPYVHHVDSNAFEVRLVGNARHNYFKSPWYIRAKQSSESFWSEPYYYYDGTNISGHYTTFVKPIFDKTVNGVPSTVYYGPIEHVDWSIAIVVAK